jgi:NAD dependent epimerase/dehydratase
MSLKNKKVLVTGAGGFIGSHLSEHLLKQGCRVRALVRYKSDGSHGFLDEMPPSQKKKIEIVCGDLKDAHAVHQMVQGMDVVFHLGALIAIPYSYQHPNDYVQTNIVGTTNILESCREHRIGRLVHVSTSEVYGSAIRVPIDERHPRQPQSPYAASKIAADAMAESYWRAFNMPITIVRPFNTFGPRQSARAVIPTMIMQALTGKAIHLGSLEPRRDFTFVTDSARGIAATATSKRLLQCDVNLGTGNDISIGEILNKIMALTAFKGQVVLDPQRIRPKESEVNRLLSDPSRMHRNTSWKARVSLLQGLKKTIAYIHKNKQRYETGRYYR